MLYSFCISNLLSILKGCTTLPAGIDDPASPASDKASVEITCRTDSEFQFCQFQHSKPMDVNDKDKEIDCSANTGGNFNQQCDDDPRISITPTSNSCNMKITSSEPDDTGRWTVVIVDLDGNQVTNAVEVRQMKNLYAINYPYANAAKLN